MFSFYKTFYSNASRIIDTELEKLFLRKIKSRETKGIKEKKSLGMGISEQLKLSFPFSGKLFKFAKEIFLGGGRGTPHSLWNLPSQTTD